MCRGSRSLAPDEGGPLLLLEAVAVALDQEGVAVMEEAIEDGAGRHLVAEDRPPVCHGLAAPQGTGAVVSLGPAMVPAVGLRWHAPGGWRMASLCAGCDEESTEMR